MMAKRRRRPWRSLPLGEWVRRGNPLQQVLRVIALVTVISVLIPGTAFAIVLTSYLFLPLPAALPDERLTEAGQISRVYGIDGSVIGEFRVAAEAIPIEADQIPDTIRDAVIAAEDADFFTHGGVDYEAIGRALIHNLTAGRIVEGGSTITQQLVKNLYTGKERSFLRKAQEAILAAQVERDQSKEEILARYLNTIYLGDSTFGIEAASRSYFDKPARDMSLSEAALLAGLIPAPSLYSPRSNPEAAEARRLRVLDQVLDHGLATPEEVAAARAEQPVVHPPPGVQGKYPWFIDYVWEYLTKVEGLPEQLVLTGGLTIETTLDPALQDRAQGVVSSSLVDPEDPQVAMVAVEPSTGFVRALVGGRDRELSQVNNALGPLRDPNLFGRQAGSSFKAFVLAQAFDSGLQPEKVYPAPRCIELPGGYRPCNYGGTGYGSATIRRAAHSSINTVFTKLILDVGVKETAELAQRMGITTIDPNNPNYGAALALGTAEVTPLDMASAFGVFAARGVRAEPTPVLKVTAPDGEVLVDKTRPARNRVLREVVADTVNDVLRGVITSGTAKRANIDRPAAGKTGTEDDYTDAWFIGYTPALSTAVWMGHEVGQKPMASRETGGNLPARMWASFMKEALKDVPKTDFTDPAPLDSLRERALRRQRGGFGVGDRRYPRGLPSEDPYYQPPPKPEASSPPDDAEPTTTTSSTGPQTTTTTGGLPFPGNSSTTTTQPDGGLF